MILSENINFARLLRIDTLYLYIIFEFYTSQRNRPSWLRKDDNWKLERDEGHYGNNEFACFAESKVFQSEIKFLTTCSRACIACHLRAYSHTHRDFLLNHLFVIPSDIIDPRFSVANAPTCIVPWTCGKHEKFTFTASTQNTLSRNPISS